MKKRDPLDTIYVVESKGELDSQWGYYWEFYVHITYAREAATNRRRSGLRARIVRYRRGAVVR
jgi:hypothetical protein